MRYQPQHEVNDGRARPVRPAWRWLAVVFVTGLAVGAWADRPAPVRATATRVEVVTRQVDRPVLSSACRRTMSQADASLADAAALQRAFAQHLDMMRELASSRATTRRTLAASMTTASGAVAADRLQRAVADYRSMTRACAGAPVPGAAGGASGGRDPAARMPGMPG
jgi:hypothetical protein